MKYLFILSIVFSSVALATSPTPPPKEHQHNNTTNTNKSYTDSNSYSKSKSKSQSESYSKSSSDSDSNASADNSQSLSQNYSYKEVSDVPPLFLPAILPSGCGAGINGAGADRGAAGALGMTWTTRTCYQFMSATAFAGIGDYETACELWTDLNRDAFKRIGKTPNCSEVAKRLYNEHNSSATSLAIPAPPVMDMSRYVTKDELIERDKRILDKSTRK